MAIRLVWEEAESEARWQGGEFCRIRTWARRPARAAAAGGAGHVAEQFDVVVVGGRCAGAPLATLLARRGVSVALVEQAAFPRDTLSSHIFEADALAFLDRLGVTEQLRETGAPFADHMDLRVEDVRLPAAEWPRREGDVGGLTSIRRLVLDPILLQAAEAAGVSVRTETRATGLVDEDGRVGGVRVSTD